MKGRPVEWGQSVERSDQIAASGLQSADTWDGRALRGVLAVTLGGLAKRQGLPPAEVDIGSVLWHLDQGPAMVRELADTLGLSAEDAQPTEAASVWAWLTRRWPKAPALANSDGMPRGIARGSSQPAVDVITHWAAGAAQDALAAERPAGLQRRTRVRVIGGEDEGREGEVVRPAWLMDDERRTVRPGPPPGYEVVLVVPGEDGGVRRVVVLSLDGEIRMESPGLHGEHVIIRADNLDPQDA